MQSVDKGESRINLTEEELVERYVTPYLEGETLVINGTTLDPKKIWRVKITASERPLDEIIKRIDYDDQRDKGVYAIFRQSAKWRAIDIVEDVTEKFINKPPGSIKKTIVAKPANSSLAPTSNKIFVVHGHDNELKNDVELFLRSINLEPVVLHRQLDEGLTVIEKFEKHSDVNYAIVLLTPDDIGYTVDEGRKKEEDRNVELRARQNVILEFGFFIGKLSRKNVCCIYKEGVTLPSDLNGLIYKKVDKTVDEIGMFLMKELKNAGLPVKYQ